jgi:hypothetical protein
MMKVVMTQLTPAAVKWNCLAITGVDTLNTVSFSTAKNMVKMIHGTNRATSMVFDNPSSDLVGNLQAFAQMPNGKSKNNGGTLDGKYPNALFY